MQTPIIPIVPTFYSIDGPSEWDFKAICVFVATGFFLDRDTYFEKQKVLPPGISYGLDSKNRLVKVEPYFTWHYSPRNISFDQAVSEFTELFEGIIDEQTSNQKVILPLSGGLDSRSQAVALKHLGKEVNSYSYEFKNGYPETNIANKITLSCGFPFQAYQIQNGYLWHSLEELAAINGCYSEFTHPRQMAVKSELGKLGDLFSLGHWGDVLFDRGVPDGINESDFPGYIEKKILKKGGKELARSLWKVWDLEGDFDSYLKDRLNELWQSVSIENLSAKMRAFKSLYWAPRWTSTNLSIFASEKPISLPYYDNRMCEFICTLPEEYLADRKIQIAYIKRRNPDIAKITWQGQKPFNLYNYHRNKVPFNLPYRIVNKLKRELDALFGKKYVQRNWELQFLGSENKRQLESYLNDPSFQSWIPKKLSQEYLDKFYKENTVYYSHPLSMLLTLAIKKKQDVR